MGNIQNNITDREIRSFFAQIVGDDSTIQEVRHDPTKRFAYVSFNQLAIARLAALDAAGKLFMGWPLGIDFDNDEYKVS